MNADDAWDKDNRRSKPHSSIQWFCFHGPSLTKDIVRGLGKKLRQHNLSKIEDAVGLIHKESN